MCVYMYINHIFSVQLSVGRRLGCFHILTIVNDAAMNTGVHISFQISGFDLFGFIILVQK